MFRRETILQLIIWVIEPLPVKMAVHVPEVKPIVGTVETCSIKEPSKFFSLVIFAIAVVEIKDTF